MRDGTVEHFPAAALLGVWEDGVVHAVQVAVFAQVIVAWGAVVDADAAGAPLQGGVVVGAPHGHAPHAAPGVRV